MKTVECPSCAMNVDSKHKHCPICGYKLMPYNKALQWVALFLAAVFLLTIFLL